MAAPKGVRVTQAHREAHAEWLEQNPLRAWRLSQKPTKLTILEAAELVGVGMSMIQMYERGVHKPVRADVAERLTELLGKGWEKRWDTWYAARPKLV